MIRIAVCDDELQQLEHAQSLLEKYMKNNPQYDMKVVSFLAPLELLTYVQQQGGFDIYLLDIYMAGMLGTDVARQLRELNDDKEIIFLTSSKDHLMHAFEVDAAQYLIKPYTEKAFFLAIGKVLKRLNIERRHFLTLKTKEGVVRLFTRYIVYTETGRNNYQIIHTIQGEKIEVRMTSVELFELLSPTQLFVRCGSSINVNLKYIRQIKKDTIVFDSGEHLAYPYRAYKKLKEDFLSFQMATEK